MTLEPQPDERIHARRFPPPPIARVVGQLPHEWLTTFADIQDWQVTVEGLEDPHVRLATYRPLFHEQHVEVSWSKVEEGKITLTPPEPLKLPRRWDSVDFWVGGIPDDYRSADMYCVLTIETRGGETHRLEVSPRVYPRRPVAIDMFHRLVPGSLRRDLQGGRLVAIDIEIPEAGPQHHLQLYCISVYRHQLKRQYQRPDQLPFPTQPDGVVPSPGTEGAVAVAQDRAGPLSGQLGPATRFSYSGADGSRLEYCYVPRTGGFGDLTAQVDDDEPFRPYVGGGIVFEADGGRLSPPYPDATVRLVDQELKEGRLTVAWEIRRGEDRFRYELDFRLVDRSLVVEVQVEGQDGLEVQIGYPEHDGRMKEIEVPMWAWEKGSRHYDADEGMGREGRHVRSPAVLLAGDYFLSAVFDWYVSDAAMLYRLGRGPDSEAGFDGGAVYLPVIDQGRNPIREKLILTVSREFQEVLPNIPNPPSPYGELMRDRVYSHGMNPLASVERHRNLGIHSVATLVQLYDAASDRGGYRPSLDAGCLDEWIDDPGRTDGGLAGLVRRARELRGIGWLIGTYTNYCLMSPVWAPFAELYPIHDEEGYHRGAPANWPGSMVPVAGETLAYMERQSRKIRDRLGLQLIYDDQRTIYPIWWSNDYTPGVPGAGKFRDTYEQVAQVYMGRRELYNGPMLSEGGVHWMYSGLVDGNIARTQSVKEIQPEDGEGPSRRTPVDIVDFQLLKIHPLTVDFCGNDYFEQWVLDTRNKFTSETLAYGKIGMWNAHTGHGHDTAASSCRTYYTFHLAQKRYRCVPAAEILYHNGREMVAASDLLKQDLEHLGRVYVRYQNGFESWVNLNPADPWTIEVDGETVDLPPYGWYQRRREDWGVFVNYSVADEEGGSRVRIQDRDAVLVSAPGHVVRWQDVETDGTVLLLREPTGGYRLVNLDANHIRIDGRKLGLASGAGAVAHTFDLDGEPVSDGVVSSSEGWLDFSFLAHEQFARIYH